MTTTNKTFNQLFPTYTDWQTLVESKALKMFPSDSEIVNALTQFVPLEQLYIALDNQYHSRTGRYEDDEMSRRLQNTFADELTSFWIKTRPYISNQLGQLKDIKERGDNEYILDNTKDAQSGKSDTTSKASSTGNRANSTTPFLSDGVPLNPTDNIGSKTSDTSAQEGTGTATTDLTRTRDINKNINRYNIIQDILKIIHSRLSLELRAFVGAFNDLFNMIVAYQLPNTADFTDRWCQQTLGLLMQDITKLFVQGEGIILDYDFANAKIKISSTGGPKPTPKGYRVEAITLASECKVFNKPMGYSGKIFIGIPTKFCDGYYQWKVDNLSYDSTKQEFQYAEPTPTKVTPLTIYKTNQQIIKMLDVTLNAYPQVITVKDSFIFDLDTATPEQIDSIKFAFTKGGIEYWALFIAPSSLTEEGEITWDRISSAYIPAKVIKEVNNG